MTRSEKRDKVSRVDYRSQLIGERGAEYRRRAGEAKRRQARKKRLKLDPKSRET